MIIELIEQNIGVEIYMLMLLGSFMLALILTAIDLRISAMINFIFNSVIFYMVYSQGLDYTVYVIAIFVSFIFLALSLLTSAKYKYTVT